MDGRRGGCCRAFAGLRKKLAIKSIFTLIDSTLKWSRYVLLMPYEGTPDHRFRLNRRHYIIYCITLFAANIVMLVTTVQQVTRGDLTNPYTALSFARLMTYVFYVLLVIFIVNQKAPNWVRLMNFLLEWDTLLPLSSKLMTDLVRIVFVQFSYFFIRSTFYVYFTLNSVSEYNVPNILRIVSVCVTSVYCEGVYIHLISNLAWFNVYLDAVHQDMREKLLPDETSEWQESLRESPWTLQTMTGSARKGKAPNVDAIRRLKLFYSKLMDIKDLINAQYSLHILLTITSIFIDMVFFVFLTITLSQFWHSLEESATLSNRLNQVVIHVISQVTKLILTVYLCERIKSKGGTAATIVHKCLQNVFSFEAKNELMIFSMELLHRSFGISAGGFFAIDFELLHTIVGAVTVYAIMLIQFNFPTPSNGENPVQSLCKFF